MISGDPDQKNAGTQLASRWCVVWSGQLSHGHLQSCVTERQVTKYRISINTHEGSALISDRNLTVHAFLLFINWIPGHFLERGKKEEKLKFMFWIDASDFAVAYQVCFYFWNCFNLQIFKLRYIPINLIDISIWI